MKAHNSKSTNVFQKRQERKNRHKFMALTGCLVVLATAFALMIPAISITDDAARQEAGFYFETHMADEAVEDGALDTASLTEIADDEAVTSEEGAIDADGVEETPMDESIDDQSSDDVVSESDQELTDGFESEELNTDESEEGSVDESTSDLATDELTNADDAAGEDVVSDSDAANNADIVDAVDTTSDADDANADANSDANSDSDDDSDGDAEGKLEGESELESVDIENGEQNASEEKTNSEKETLFPAQKFRQEFKELNGDVEIVTFAVDVDAPKGALPEGTTMKVEAVEGDDLQAVENAAQEAIDRDSAESGNETAPRVTGAQAVDITFFDKEENEIEPQQPITVKLMSNQLNDPVAQSGEFSDAVQNGQLTGKANPESAGAASGQTYVNASGLTSTTVAPVVVHVDNDGNGDVVDSLTKKDLKKRNLPKAANDELVFDANTFSVYAIVYTVDFHYEIDGKTYDFSIPGGGFVSLEHLVEVLGITRDTNPAEKEAKADETGMEIAPLTLDDVVVSEATRKFVADVASAEFSNPDLVWVGKVEAECTVGELKESNGLECQYSAELTENQIEEIDVQTVEPEDWALISMQPFTSEESLEVTMRNGEVFTIKVTDAQKPYKDVSTLENGTYIIYQSFSNSTKIMYLKNDGTSKLITPGNGEAITDSDLSSYTWQVTKNGNGTWTIKSAQGNRYINLSGNSGTYNWSSSNSAGISLSGSNGIVVSNGNKVLKRNDTDGFYVSTGTGAGLTFYKIESNSSGGTTHDTGIELTDAEREMLSKWEETIEKFNTLTDYNKTAEASDYDNRIYKIDITADSGIMDFYKDVDLGFVLDVSNSMKFPSSLKSIEDASGNEQQVWMTADSLNSAKEAYSDYYSRQSCFYILSDPALTATIYRIFWNGNKWQYQDASSNDSSKIFDINNGTVFKEPYRQAYTLYYADDTIPRMDYLNASVEQAVETLKKIVQPTEGADDETANVRIAYNFFAGTKTNSSGQVTQYAIRGSHDFVDLRSQESRTFEVKPKGNEADGTRQDLALYESNNDPNLAANEFGWDTESDVDRYVILVTDGAPNGASMSDVENAAQRLKAEDQVKIITIGLSTKDVDGGSTLLKTIADDLDGDGKKDFYEAEKASDLKHILLKILQTLMAKGLVRGTITDTIDQGFYPVDVDGNPLNAGVYNANGTHIQNAQISEYVADGKAAAAHQNEAFYTWEQVGDEWKITWYNQEIGWNDNDATTGEPWTGTVYVKAKEDYLGGNLIATNDGNAQIEPTGLKLVINGTSETNWRPLEGMTPVDLPVPRVNVHNLETDGNETTWTVYKGTSVTPKDQIVALWNAIPVEEVVSETAGDNHKVTTGQTANVGTNGEGETFKLADLLTELGSTFDINSLIDNLGTGENATVTSDPISYTAYGHESGTITVTLKREVGTAEVTQHNAESVGSPVEKYSLTVTYRPYSENVRESKIATNQESGYTDNTNHHNGQAGRGAEETGTMTSTNAHTINVFQKGVKVTKVDLTNPDKKLTGAVFELFRADTNGDANVSAYNLPEGNYSKIGSDLAVNANGEIVINPVIPDVDTAVSGKTLYLPNITVGATENASHNTVFYLVEKTPPTDNGIQYSNMPGAIKLTMTLSEGKGTNADAILYDWAQTAVITAEEYGNGAITYLISDGETNNIYAYRLKNGRPTDITLIKTDKKTHNSISGAKFRLIRESENVDLTKLTITAITGGGTIIPEDYDLNGTPIKVVTVPEGGIKIAGLIDGAYTLYEVAAPAGYIITNQGKAFEAENGTIKNHTDEADGINFEVENEPGTALPNTGGPGTNLLYLLGSTLIGLAGAGIIMKRRRREAA